MTAQEIDFVLGKLAIRPSECPKRALTLGVIIEDTDSHAIAQPKTFSLGKNPPDIVKFDLAPADCAGFGINPANHGIGHHVAFGGLVAHPIRRQRIDFFQRKSKANTQGKIISSRSDFAQIVDGYLLKHHPVEACHYGTALKSSAIRSFWVLYPKKAMLPIYHQAT